MKKRNFIVFICAFLVSACSSKTQVHLFATHLSERNIEQIHKALNKDFFELHVNQHPFPQKISNDTLIYTPSRQYHTRIGSILSSLETLGYEISSTTLLAQGNHSYSVNNFGLYLFPKDYVAKTPNYKIPLINEYGAIDCHHATNLTLKADNSFVIEVDIWLQDKGEYLLKTYQGKWLKINEQIELKSQKWDQTLRFTRSTSEYNHNHGRSHVVSLVPHSKANNRQQNLLNCTYTISLAL